VALESSGTGWRPLSEQHLPIARNTATLAVIQALYSAVLQLGAAVLSLSFVLVTGFRSLLGAGPAIFLTASALSALPAGRAMDRFGRVPVIAVGFILGSIGYSLAAVGTHWGSGVALIAGFALAGVAGAVTLLIRTAAGDMYPPERRARGISYVLFGSVFGAVLGPSLFGPLFAGKDVAADTLTVPWLAAAGLSLVTCGLALTVRPDTKVIAERIGAGDGPTPPAGEAAPLREILRRPGVIPAMLAAIASFGVMVSVMNLTGFVVVDHHHHSQQAVFPIIGAHVLGMYALVLVIGTLIDKIGRGPALAGGLFVMAISCAGLTWATSVPTTALLLFGLGIGWNLSFVAATAQLADATLPAERGKVLGLSDLLSGLTGAGLALLGGVALDVLGVTALALGATAIAVAPAIFLARIRPAPEPAA
jgi:MFS family permease